MRAFISIIIYLTLTPVSICLGDNTAKDIVRAAIDYLRDESSITVADMTVHRSDWERTMSMEAWTKGTKRSLVRFTAPAKDKGNASLTIDDDIWSYNPKINKVIKIPPSMKNQSWMGSDFSYQDLARGDDIIEDYDHSLLGEERIDGKVIYSIQATPHDTAPIVWGKEVLKIRDDHLVIEHLFFDQDMALVKSLVAREIKPLGGKLYATTVRMTKHESPEEWTEVSYRSAEFGATVPDMIFTLSNLNNPRE